MTFILLRECLKEICKSRMETNFNFIKMARKFGKYGWNRQFKNKPLRRDRWDPFPKDHLPFIDDFSVGSYLTKKEQVNAMRPKRKFDDMSTPTTLLGKRRPELSIRKAA